MVDGNGNDALKTSAKTALVVGKYMLDTATVAAVLLTKMGIAGWKNAALQYENYKIRQQARLEELARQQEAAKAEAARLAQEEARLAEERRVKHTLGFLRCQVAGPPQRYLRPNADGSIYFEGTQLHLLNILTPKYLDLSFEGLFGFAMEGDVIDIVLASVDFEMPQVRGDDITFTTHKITVPVVVINRLRGGFHPVQANIVKHNDEKLGGQAQLRKDIENYCKQELNITFT